MIPNSIETLIIKYLRGTASDKETRELHEWYQKADLSQIELKDITPQELEESGLRIHQNLAQHAKAESARTGRLLWWKTAAVLILVSGGFWWLHTRLSRDAQRNARIAAITNLQPGHKGAVLHLDDGRTIQLDSTGDGLIASESGVQIMRDSSGIRYKGASLQPVYNTISTAKGRMWSLLLPDGTKVCLNAASSIRFPLNFTGHERLVELTGEAFFEVVHNAHMPFRVKVGSQVIEDLGTSFNINAYGDNQNIITTLVQGSLRIDSKAMNCVLIPGQQARIGKDNIVCAVSRIETVTSWKDGYFDFYDAGLKEMLQQISRWYNFEVAYKPGLTKERFTGKFPKNLTLGKALEILRQAGINFTIEPGQQTKTTNIIVSPL